MFISIPKEFFVPVLFNEEFRYNFESNTMDYETESEIKEEQVESCRWRLADKEDSVEAYHGNETEEIQEEEIQNIEDKVMEEKIASYMKAFMIYIAALEESCEGKNKEEELKKSNEYANRFRKIYDEYKKIISEIKEPLSDVDKESLVNYYMGEFEAMYQEHLGSLKCKEEDYEYISRAIEEVLEETRKILKESIDALNDEIIRKQKNQKLEDRSKYASEIYNKIDDEFSSESIEMEAEKNKNNI